MEHLAIKWGLGREFPSHHGICILELTKEGLFLHTTSYCDAGSYFKEIKTSRCEALEMVDETLNWLNTIDGANIDKYKEKYEDYGGSCYTYSCEEEDWHCYD